MFAEFTKTVILTAFLTILFAATMFGQTEGKIDVEGVLNKSADNKYSIGEFQIQLPKDKQDSYKFYYDVYVGQNIKFRGVLIGDKRLEGDDIWYDGNAQPTKADYPSIISKGEKVEDFIPKNWVVLQQATGDLNGDGQDDAVLAIRGDDLKYYRYSYDVRGKAQFLTNPITKAWSAGTDGNPRILLVLLKEKDGYKLFAQNNTLLPISRFGIGESLTSVGIKNGELTIDFNWGDPHWGFIERNFTFKNDNSEMSLVKSKYSYRKTRGFGEPGLWEYDFTKKEVKITKEIEDEKEPKLTTVMKSIKLETPLTLKNLIDFSDVEKKAKIEPN